MKTLFYGENLEILRNKIADNSVDLCYIDPQFNSKKSYFQPERDNKERWK